MNIFVYWVGNNNVKNEIEKKFNLLKEKFNNINIYIGPNNDEHMFLSKNFRYYEYYFKKKNYAMCSDIYRVYKLSNNKGIYLDATIKINFLKFEELIYLLKNNETVVIRENGHLIWNGFLYSTNTDLYKKILNFYKKHFNIAKSLTGPLIYSIFIYKEYGANLKNKKLKCLDARDINPYSPDSFLNYNGFGSWGKNKVDYENREKTGAHSYFYRNAIKFEQNKISKLNVIIRWFMKIYMLYLLPIIFVSNLFNFFK